MRLNPLDKKLDIKLSPGEHDKKSEKLMSQLSSLKPKESPKRCVSIFEQAEKPHQHMRI